MTYELAKQLKDAGFPNIRIGDYFEHTMGSHSDTRDSEPCYCNQDKLPFLSELIEACGEDIIGLTRMWQGVYLKGWGAIYSARSIDSFHSCIEGSTPEEAVAKLWLELNKKDK